jgi:hypothetical protein
MNRYSVGNTIRYGERAILQHRDGSALPMIYATVPLPAQDMTSTVEQRRAERDGRARRIVNALNGGDMEKYELSKPDFDLIDAALAYFIKDHEGAVAGRARDLRERFENAHAAWVETDK